MMIISQALTVYTAQLYTIMSHDEAWRESHILLSHALCKPQLFLITHPDDALDDSIITRMNHYIERRLHHEPIAYIIGYKEFFSLSFFTEAPILIPRPLSEYLIEHVIQHFPKNTDATILDIGSGTGCLLLSLLHNLPQSSGVGLDKNEAAINLGTRNAVNLSLDKRAHFIQHDITSQADSCPDMLYDIIITNPPYIRRPVMEHLSPDITCYEDNDALLGGDDGLDIIRHILPYITSHLAPNGFIAIECAQGQADYITNYIAASSLKHIVNTNHIYIIEADEPTIATSCSAD